MIDDTSKNAVSFLIIQILHILYHATTWQDYLHFLELGIVLRAKGPQRENIIITWRHEPLEININVKLIFLYDSHLAFGPTSSHHGCSFTFLEKPITTTKGSKISIITQWNFLKNVVNSCQCSCADAS